MPKDVFRVSLTSIRAAMAEIPVTQKFRQNTDGQTAFQLYIETSNCTCPIVQEQMISYYNDIDLYMLNAVNTEWTKIKETTAATLKHWPWTFPG